MKKYLLYIAFFAFALSFAYSATPFEFFSITEIVNGSIEDDELIGYARVRNTTDKDVKFNLKMDFVEKTLGHEAAVCWDLCFDYTDGTFVSPETYTLEAFEESIQGQFTAHLHPYKRISIDPLLYTNPVPGKTVVRFSFIPVDNPSDLAELLVTFNVVDPSNSVDDDLKLSDNSTFPNPASDILNLNFENEIKIGTTAEIIDLTGKFIKSVELNYGSNNTIVPVSDLQSGNYLLKLKSEKITKVRKFSVVR